MHYSFLLQLLSFQLYCFNKNDGVRTRKLNFRFKYFKSKCLEQHWFSHVRWNKSCSLHFIFFFAILFGKVLKIVLSQKLQEEIFQASSEQNALSDEECYAIERGADEDFDNCCVYPFFDYPETIVNFCLEKAGDWTNGSEVCDYYVCMATEFGVLTVNRDADGKFISSDMIWFPIFDSFLASTGDNVAIWEPVVKNVWTRCVDQFGGMSSDYSCEVIPINMDDVIHCTYKQVYLQCPTWNPHGLPNCSYNFEYVSKCY